MRDSHVARSAWARVAFCQVSAVCCHCRCASLCRAHRLASLRATPTLALLVQLLLLALCMPGLVWPRLFDSQTVCTVPVACGWMTAAFVCDATGCRNIPSLSPRPRFPLPALRPSGVTRLPSSLYLSLRLCRRLIAASHSYLTLFLCHLFLSSSIHTRAHRQRLPGTTSLTPEKQTPPISP